jgi:hypothetical protein
MSHTAMMLGRTHCLWLGLAALSGCTPARAPATPGFSAPEAGERVRVPEPGIPSRARDAMGGRAFIASVVYLSRDAREAAVRRELMAGNVPSFLRILRPVQVRAQAPDGSMHTATYEVMPDYLAIGSDEDFVRMPMTPATAQAFLDAFGFVLPTRKMVNDIWAAAELKVEPRPLRQERESPGTFLQHHELIQSQLGDRSRAFVSGIKKDVVVSNVLRQRPHRVAIYGWHYPAGQPIQPLYAGHAEWYVDYSHGIRPVRRWMIVDGERRSHQDVLRDDDLHVLLSDEGPIADARYPGDGGAANPAASPRRHGNP